MFTDATSLVMDELGAFDYEVFVEDFAGNRSASFFSSTSGIIAILL